MRRLCTALESGPRAAVKTQVSCTVGGFFTPLTSEVTLHQSHAAPLLSCIRICCSEGLSPKSSAVHRGEEEGPGLGKCPEGPGLGLYLGLHLGQGFARKRLDSQGGMHRPLSFYSGTGHLL